MREKISLVVPTLNGGERLVRLLAVIAAQRRGVDEIIVVDSGSSDGTVERAREAGAEVVPIPAGEFNHGLTRDLGIERARGEFVILMSQDAVPGDEGLIENLLAGFAERDVAGVSGRQVVRRDADVLLKRRLRRADVAALRGWVHRIEDRAGYAALSAMERYRFCRFDNVCSAIRRSAWEGNRFGDCAFGEDIGWAKRVLESGGAIGYAPEAWVVHSHAADARSLYLRTYMDHQMLHRVFGLKCVPTRGRLVRAVVGGIMRDAAYVSMRQPGMLHRVPGLTWASASAQYRAARDGEN